MSRKLLSSTAVAAVASAFLVGCGSSTSSSSTATTASASTAASSPATKSTLGPIKIGALLPLTGASATSGQDSLNGVNLAVSEINASGGINGRKLTVQSEDNQSSNQGTVAGITKLLTSHPAAIIGPSVSGEVEAAGPSISQAGIPFFFGGTLPSLTHSGNPWLFRDRPTDEFFAWALADYGVKTLHITSWAVLHSADAYGTGAATYLVTDLKADGAKVVTDLGSPAGTTDFTSEVLQIKNSGAQGIASFLGSDQTNGLFAKQRQQLGLGSVPWVASGSAVTTAALKLGGSAMNGIAAVTDYVPSSNPAATSFDAAYLKQYGTAPDVNSAYTFDAVNIIAAAIKAAGTTAPASLRTAILGISNLQGVDGKFSFDKYGDGAHNVNVVTVKNGVPTYTTTVALPALPYIKA